MSDACNLLTSKVSFKNIDIPDGLRAFLLEDLDNGNTMTFIEVGHGTDEWAVKFNDLLEFSYVSTAEARKRALQADQDGIARHTDRPALMEAA